jgi:two-component system sensor histidine kinase YesM
MRKEIWKRRFRSFGFQVAAFYLLAGLLILSLFGGVIYFVVSDIFVQESVAKAELAIEKSAAEIGADIRNAKSLLRLLSETPVFTDYAISGSDAQKHNVMRLMNVIKEGDGYVFGIFAAFSDGRIVGENADDTFISEADYETLLQNDMPFLSTARTDNYPHDDGCVITMGVPIESENGDSLGVLAMDLDYCMIHDVVFDMDFGGTIYIIDKSEQIIFQTDSESAEPLDFSLGYDAMDNVLTQRYAIPETEWFVVGRVHLVGLTVLMRQLLHLVAFTGALLFFALLFITVGFSRKLTTPIARLAKNMEDIENLAELTLLADEISETKVLTESYNRMIQKIKLLMSELEHKQEALRKTEIAALTSQINPHFLYNTLDTIVWLAEFRDNERIIALTKSLAAFFRLSLNQGRSVVSLGDELDHTRQYLFIQKERYADKLTYSFDVAENLLDCMVPKIILQPIVENSIYHGIRPMDGVGHIEISAVQKDGGLFIVVKDNGVGFDVQKTSGVGLRNVESRIKLYYGEDCGIAITSAPGAGTTVRLILKTDLQENA